MEDVFCEESIKVLLQFLRSQLGHDKSFWSYDGQINYTQEQQDNFELLIFSVIGNLDKIVPAETIEDVLNLPKPKKIKKWLGLIKVILNYFSPRYGAKYYQAG